MSMSKSEIVVEILAWINGRFHSVYGKFTDRVLGIDCRMAGMNNFYSSEMDVTSEFSIPDVLLARAVGCYAGLFIRVGEGENTVEKYFDDNLHHAGYCVVITSDLDEAITLCCRYLDGNL